MTTGLLGVGVSFAEELSGVVTVRGVTTATVGATIVWVASMAMVLTVFPGQAQLAGHRRDGHPVEHQSAQDLAGAPAGG